MDDQDRLLAELVTHPAWDVLRERAKKRKKERFDIFATYLMEGRQVDEAALSYARGFFRGMEFLLRQPKLAQSAIEKELAKREEVTPSA